METDADCDWTDLEKHLLSMTFHTYESEFVWRDIAEGILNHPQAHIDALVAAGVLGDRQ